MKEVCEKEKEEEGEEDNMHSTVNTNTTDIITNVEAHITHCVTLIQSVFRRWRDKKLILNAYAQFEVLCKEVEYNINASFKHGFQKQYRTEVKFPTAGNPQFVDIMDGMKLFMDRNIFTPYTSTAKSSLLYQQQQRRQQQQAQSCELHKINKTDREIPALLAEKSILSPSRSVFNLTSIERSTSYHEDDVFIDVHSSSSSSGSSSSSSNVGDVANAVVNTNDRIYSGDGDSSSSASEDGAVVNASHVEGDKITSDTDTPDNKKSSLKDMCIEELKQEERWLEKAIIARIRYLKKDGDW